MRRSYAQKKCQDSHERTECKPYKNVTCNKWVAPFSRQKPEKVVSDLKKIKTLALPSRHEITLEDLHPDSLSKIILSTYERQPRNFEELLGLSGVGAKTLRALSLISELVHGVPPSRRDPARYSFAHGGKDGIPYPVDRETYDKSIELLSKAVSRSKLSMTEKNEAIRRLGRG